MAVGVCDHRERWMRPALQCPNFLLSALQDTTPRGVETLSLTGFVLFYFPVQFEMPRDLAVTMGDVQRFSSVT